MLYQITAHVVREASGWRMSVQVPTFYLNSDIQGIADANHAARIACKIVDPLECALIVTCIAASEAGETGSHGITRKGNGP